MAQTDKKLYTDPQLRERLKRKIEAEDRGGPAGKWSLRKSALLAHDYEEAGGGYRTRKRTPKQANVKRALKRVSDRGRAGTRKQQRSR